MMFLACCLLLSIPVAIVVLALQAEGSPENVVDSVNIKPTPMPIPVLLSNKKKKVSRSGFKGIYEEDDMYANTCSNRF